MKQIKGAVSFQINQLGVLTPKFNWQIGYGAFSVSEDRVPKVEGYVRKQKEHHRTETFAEELARFWKAYGMEWVEQR